MNKISSIALILTICVSYIESHGELLVPPNRGRAWRVDKRFPKGVLYTAEWCDQVNNLVDRVPRERNVRHSKCGICGPIYNNDPTGFTPIYKGASNITAYLPSFEASSPVYLGLSVATYKTGETIDVQVKTPAFHKGGPNSFHICEASYKNDPSQECLDSHPLEFEDGNVEKDLVTAKKVYRGGNTFAYKVKLPANLKCEHCVLQWKWFARNTKQEYHSCADVTIV